MSLVDPGLLAALSALKPYLEDIVIVGGWVPYLYAIYQDSTRSRPPKTRDLDIAVPRKLPLRGASIDTLLSEAGFDCEFRSLDTPPVTRYVVRSKDGMEIEFVTDAPGSHEGVITVQAGLTAQELHYLRLLLDNSWHLDLANRTGGAVDYTVRAPTPAAFIVHKGLTYRDRQDRLKREKDLYYVFYVVNSFPEWQEWMRADLRALAALTPAWLRRCANNRDDAFRTPESAGTEAVLHQRPETAYPGMNADQFRQYVWDSFRGLVDAITAALRVPGT